MNKYSFTDILFATPSFFSGVAKILDLGATFDDYNYSMTAKEADVMAIKSDFLTIGNDINYAIEQFNK